MKKIFMLSLLLLGTMFLSGCVQRNVYKDEKYNFSIKYPPDWVVDENKTLAGPNFRPKNLSIQDIQAGKYDKNKDCFFAIAFLSASQDKKISCRDNLGEVTLGLNKFTKCDAMGIKYMILHPKTNIIVSFDYLDNSSCKDTFEKFLETLAFN